MTPAVTSAKLRLDERLVRDGLAESRTRAQAAVLAGRVTVDGVVADKPGRRVAPRDRVALAGPAHPYVSRGGVKLAHALAAFGIAAGDARACDLGASTGGFTDCLLRAGAARVYAVDVGQGQLAWTLRQDPRVVVMERRNARHLTPEDLGGPCDIVTADLSFIGLRGLWPVIGRLVRPDGDVIALVKPQFEAGRAHVRRGGVCDPTVHAAVLEQTLAAAARDGLRPASLAASPITGPAGNIEYLAHLVRGERPTALEPGALPFDVQAIVADAHPRLGRRA